MVLLDWHRGYTFWSSLCVFFNYIQIRIKVSHIGTCHFHMRIWHWNLCLVWCKNVLLLFTQDNMWTCLLLLNKEKEFIGEDQVDQAVERLVFDILAEQIITLEETFFWDVMLCSLVDGYKHCSKRYLSTGILSVLSWKIVIGILTATRTSLEH